jgi:spore cortex biosynthesis protein YabQ
MQTQLFFVAIQIGILMGMLYDVIRIFRKIIPHPDWIVQVEDLLYWALASILAFIVLYIHNYSALRFFVFIGIALGSVFYFATFSIIFMKIATWIICFVKSVLKTCIHILSIPIKWAIRIIQLPFRWLANIFTKVARWTVIKIRKTKRKYYYHKYDMYTYFQLKIKK